MKIAKRLKAVRVLAMFANSILKASMLKAEVLNRKLKIYEQQKEWARAMIDFSIPQPTLIAACGSESVFGGDFDKVVLTEHNVKFGLKIHGSKYSEMQNIENYMLQYMDFQKNTVVCTSMANEMIKIEDCPYEIMKDSYNQQVVREAYARCILTKIHYNEQMYRSKLANAMYTRTKEQANRLRFAWARARAIKLTNEVLLISNNNRHRR